MNSRQVFERFVPSSAVSYCDTLYQKLGFEFKIKRARQTKLGDYRFDHQKGKHIITINNDLNPYAFLVTYLHEVAHLIAFERHRSTILPHGKEWKQCFKEVAAPVLNEQTFHPPVLLALRRYFQNPKASSCSDPVLFQVLKQYDPTTDAILLREIAPGQEFILNKRRFRKLEKKRTRSLCIEVKTGKKYAVAELAEVTPV